MASLTILGFCGSTIPYVIDNIGQYYQPKSVGSVFYANEATIKREENNSRLGASISNIGFFGGLAKSMHTLGTQTVSVTSGIFPPTPITGK